MQPKLKEREPQRTKPAPAPITPPVISASAAVLPLRLFLSISFLYAGIDKLFDLDFLNPNASGYIGNQLTGFAQNSPIGGFLTSVAVPNATLFGVMMLAGELAIGLGTLVGLFSRTAAFFGMVISLTLWVSTTWNVTPFFLASDLPYAMGWLVLALAGAHPVWSLDGQIQLWLNERKRQEILKQGKRAVVHPPNPELVRTQARRHFLAVAGGTLVAGSLTGVAWFNSVSNRNANSTTQSVPIETSPIITSTPVTNPFANNPQPVTTTAQGQFTATTSTPANATKTTAVANTSAPINGKVLGAIASLPVGGSLKFITPDTGDRAIVIHNSNGSVKAFSSICTHEGCEVTYYPNQQYLECPCHGARFDPNTGAVLRRPANRPLKAYNVSVDNSGNIIYQLK
ncbi:MAG: Rieske 2Fe-2S domain-containing protein [Chloroflexi bacterium]|uniref:Rieske 2Fe-2S domain-containing protein n=1 Tax=Candidatus Chlorohelix allophototropha TaxID=3003348 RepID=A0A8T7LZU8_9CHLR|nr:Rieske 2Fe-2S domain-containing protein [Chloroflexota bacterium]WJW67726.1 Rieske 2Fe-2S domain-containing protein [Chloroflexota bacterium L227-S17]